MAVKMDTQRDMASSMLAMLAVAAFCSLAVGPAIAQQSSRAKPRQPAAEQGESANKKPAELVRGEEMIRKTAYGMTASARSVEDLTRIIDTCQKGLQLGVEPATVEYASKLMAWAHNRRGEAYLSIASKTKDPQQHAELDGKALAEFETAIGLDATCWRALHNRGVSLAQKRHFDEALADFNRTIELQKGYPNAWFNRGEVRYVKGQYQEAIDDYNEVLRLKPDDAPALNSRGHARYRLGYYREALEDYNQAVRIEPKNVAALTNRGDAFMDQGNWERAAQDYRAAIQINPNYGRAFQSAAWLMATCPDERFRETQKAIDAATKALQLDGAADYRYLDALAAAYANAGRFDDAQETQKKAVAMAKGDAAKSLQQRLELYAESKPYRSSPRLAFRNPNAPGVTNSAAPKPNTAANPRAAAPKSNTAKANPNAQPKRMTR